MNKYLILAITLFMGINYSFAQDDPFEGRPSTAGPDVASSKPNVPDKKESFTDKLNRYKSEGFKVAVVLYSGDIATKQKDPGATAANGTIGLEGTVPDMRSDLMPLVEDFTKSMNEAFSTDVFEVVDLKSIPYKESKWGKVDDWGSTKYKMVITYNANPVYNYSFWMDKYEGYLSVQLGVTGTEFINDKKGVKMKYPIRTGNLGLYQSPKYTVEANPTITTTEELQTLVNPPSGSEIATELMKLQSENIGDFIEKRKK
jgi:hypothetical protein